MIMPVDVFMGKNDGRTYFFAAPRIEETTDETIEQDDNDLTVEDFTYYYPTPKGIFKDQRE